MPSVRSGWQQIRQTLNQLLQGLAPGGELVIGSNRSAGRLWTLAGATGIPAAAMTMRRGTDDAKLFLHIHLKQANLIGFVTQWAASVVHLN